MVYLKGLMSDQERKSVEPIALQFARGRNGKHTARKAVVALQDFGAQVVDRRVIRSELPDWLTARSVTRRLPGVLVVPCQRGWGCY